MKKPCAVIGCKSDLKQGLMLFRFPKEAKRREKWITLVNRPNWQPHSNSVLCELHFGKDQWEKNRVDGRKKLTCSAFPSLLSRKENSSSASLTHILDMHNYCLASTALAATSPSYKDQDISHVQALASSTSENSIQLHDKALEYHDSVHSNAIVSSQEATHELHVSTDKQTLPSKLSLCQNTSLASQSPLKDITSISQKCSTSLQPRTLDPCILSNTSVSQIPFKDVSNSNFNSIPIRPATSTTSVELAQKRSLKTISSPIADTIDLNKSVENLKLQLKIARKKIDILKLKQVQTQKVTRQVFSRYCNIKKEHTLVKKKFKRLKDFVNQSDSMFRGKLRSDQLNSLSAKTTRGKKWSNETITDGLKYKMKWGTQGYIDFVRQIPIFPSIRCLQKAVKHMQFDSEILEEVSDVAESNLKNV